MKSDSMKIDFYSFMTEDAVKDLHGILSAMNSNNDHGDIHIIVVDGEVKFINDTVKHKY